MNGKKIDCVGLGSESITILFIYFEVDYRPFELHTE